MTQALIERPLREGGVIRLPQNRWLAALARIAVQAGGATLLSFLFMFILLPLWAAGANLQKAVDTERSVLTVRVYKTGLFSAFGHEHRIGAPIQKGTLDEDKATVDFVVEARTLRVLDSDVSDKDRTEIQATMLGPKVLDSDKFPEIRFHSTDVNRLSEGKWIAHGDLTLHGQTHPMKANVERVNGRYRGSAQLRQKEFGITPVTVAGGSIKVKDEIRVEFEIIGK